MPDQNQKFELDEEKWKTILDGKDVKTILEYARKFADDRKVKPTQLRGFYDLFRELKEKTEEEEIKKHVGKILIKLEYARGRNNISGRFYKGLAIQLNKILDEGLDERQKENLINFMEAVVAYTKTKQ